MSAYTEWKYGLITDEEYSYSCRQEDDERGSIWDENYNQYEDDEEEL